MTDALANCGPDSQHTWVAGAVALGHALLATHEDYPEVAQPYSIDGISWLTGDIRLDARAELVAELERAAQVSLKSAPDSDLLLHAYRAWGESCVDHLMGDFTFAIWNSSSQTLFCARDQLGLKPLYYALVGQVIAVSNSLNCIRSHPKVSNQLDDQAVVDFLTHGYKQGPERTTFADVKRLPPAHFLRWRDGRHQVIRYWDLRPQEAIHFGDARDYVESLRDLLYEAVRDRLRTRRASIFLSGGLDSTIVAAVARDAGTRHDSGFELRAYSIAYERMLRDDDRAYSAMMARHLGISIQYVEADNYALYDSNRMTCFGTPEPTMMSIPALWADLRQAAARHSRVVLVGDGPDVLLYYPFQPHLIRMLRSWRFLKAARDIRRYHVIHRQLPPLRLRRRLSGLAGRASDHTPMPDWIRAEFREQVEHVEPRRLMKAGTDAWKHSDRFEAVSDLLGPFWRCDFEAEAAESGESQLERRCPYFDLRVVNYLLAIPPIPWAIGKSILRELGSSLLPESIRARRKSLLPDDPTLLRIRSSGRAWTPGRDLAIGASRYVDVSRIPTQQVLSGQTYCGNSLYPFQFGFWLDAVAKPNPPPSFGRLMNNTDPSQSAPIPSLPVQGGKLVYSTPRLTVVGTIQALTLKNGGKGNDSPGQQQSKP